MSSIESNREKPVPPGGDIDPTSSQPVNKKQKLEEQAPHSEDFPQTGLLMERQQEMERTAQTTQQSLLAQLPENVKETESYVVSTPAVERDLRFINFLKSVFTHGIVCEARAEKLGIKTKKSVDIQPNLIETEATSTSSISSVEKKEEAEEKKLSEYITFNIILQKEALSDAVTNFAKGALTIALERQDDKLIEKKLTPTLTKEELDQIKAFVKGKHGGDNPTTEQKELAIAEFKKMVGEAKQQKYEKALADIQDSKFSIEELNTLSERVFQSVLIVSTSKGLFFIDNDGMNAQEAKEHLVQYASRQQERDSSRLAKDDEATPIVHEYSLKGNLPAEGFTHIILPERYKVYSEQFSDNIRDKLIFVPSKDEDVAYNYGVGRSNSVAVTLEVPEFSTALQELWDQNFSSVSSSSSSAVQYFVTHLSRTNEE